MKLLFRITIVGVGGIRPMDVGSSRNPWLTLQVLARNPVDNAIEEGRGDKTSLSGTGANLKGS